MKIKKANRRVKVSPLPRAVRSVIDVVASFGRGNVVNATLPSTVQRNQIRRELRKKWSNITSAVVTFPDCEPSKLTFGQHRISNLNS